MANAARRRPAGRARALLVLACCLCAFAGQVPQARAVLPTPTISISETVLTPYTSGGCFSPTQPCYVVAGTTVPGSTVTVTVTDDTGSGFAITTSTQAAAEDDPGAGVVAGEWLASPNVTDLGVHGEGSSVLTFAAEAEHLGQKSPPAVVTATKVARTEGDTTAPVIEPIPRSASKPPSIWSRFVCIDCFGGPLAILCITNGTCGTTQIRGRGDDLQSGSKGLASEIADVVITINDSNGALFKEIHSFTRRGTQVFYNAVLQIDDFPIGQYSYAVRAYDAWGNASIPIQGGFLVLI